MEIAVRAYTKRKGKDSKVFWPRSLDVLDFDRIFLFDTECRDDATQALTFGSFAIYNNDAIEKIGVFYDPSTLTDQEINTLKESCEGNMLIKLYTLREFVEDVFYPIVYWQQVPCVGFNLAFDLPRLAIGYGYAKGNMKGGFTLKLADDKAKYPDIRIKHISGAESFIKFQQTKFNTFKGVFVDCMNIASILMDRKRVSLAEVSKRYNKDYFKTETDEYGQVTNAHIDYNLNDVLTTAEAFRNLKLEYDKYGVQLPISSAFSSASIGKAALEDLGISTFRQLNPLFSPKIIGKINEAYYGGRCECRVRKAPIKVAVLDFSSMYPSLFILLGLYNFLIAKRISYDDDTENVKRLTQSITKEKLRDREIWKQFNVIVEIAPGDDLLPVRMPYSGENNTVGLNHLTFKGHIWYGLPSIILSWLDTGRMPKIKSAIRFTAHGVQDTLKPATILGMDIDPKKDNLFQLLVEQKEIHKKLDDKKDKPIKILANATSYGIFIELLRELYDSEIVVYGGNEVFDDIKRHEREGKYYNPIIATMITDGAKLLLGLGDLILKEHNEVVAYCDTDSLFVPKQYTEEIVQFYDSLNPYKNIDHLLKVDYEEIMFYGISAKRYCLYSIDQHGNITIHDSEWDEDYSLHGLGHLLNPFGKKQKHWQKQIWEDILSVHYKKMSIDEFLNKYRSFYAISEFTVSTETLMRRFSKLNKGKSYREGIKPFNFMHIGFSNYEDVKPIAPYSKDSQEMPHNEFINYKNGKMMKGDHYFKSLADELYTYIDHPESKLEGAVGVLQRRHIVADKIVHIGKEADNIGQNLSGLETVDQNIFENRKDITKLKQMYWEDVKSSGISRMQFFRIKKRLMKGKIPEVNDKTWAKLRKIL